MRGNSTTGPEAVSYTHLDVYKRQPDDRAPAGAARRPYPRGGGDAGFQYAGHAARSASGDRREMCIRDRIVTLFFPSKEVSVTNYYYKVQAKSAYQIADAMIKERNKTKEE